MHLNGLPIYIYMCVCVCVCVCMHCAFHEIFCASNSVFPLEEKVESNKLEIFYYKTYNTGDSELRRGLGLGVIELVAELKLYKSKLYH